MLRHYSSPNQFGEVLEVHIADIHFGAIDPETEYNILVEQFLTPISKIKFDILSIDGDLFDKKFLASAAAVDYASRFVYDCINICMINNATMMILAGTKSHDADQLSMFYGFTYRDDVDFRIIEDCHFEYAKGLKILCIPEEYGKSAEYYADKLCDTYDTVFMHGTIVGSVYGANKYVLETKKAPIFNLEAFAGCRGPIIAGHVHKAACFESYMYYVSNPVRYRFGEEEEKGYGIVLHSPMGHLYHFCPITSFRYDTIDISSIAYNDPSQIITYLDNIKAQGIDHIRIDFSSKSDFTAQNLVERYYANDPTITIKRYTDSSSKEKPVIENAIDEKYNKMDFLIDPSVDSYTKFVNFVNYNEGKTILTVDQLKAILSGQDMTSIF